MSGGCCGCLVVGCSEGLTVANLFSMIFVCRMCVFVSHPMKIVTVLRKKRLHLKTGC